jgi:hypothetical protein
MNIPLADVTTERLAVSGRLRIAAVDAVTQTPASGRPRLSMTIPVSPPCGVADVTVVVRELPLSAAVAEEGNTPAAADKTAKIAMVRQA